MSPTKGLFFLFVLFSNVGRIATNEKSGNGTHSDKHPYRSYCCDDVIEVHYFPLDCLVFLVCVSTTFRVSDTLVVWLSIFCISAKVIVNSIAVRYVSNVTR